MLLVPDGSQRPCFYVLHFYSSGVFLLHFHSIHLQRNTYMNYRLWLRSFALCLILLSFVVHAEQPTSKSPEEIRAAFLKIVDRPKVPLAPEVQASPAESGIIHERFTFASDDMQRVPGI